MRSLRRFAIRESEAARRPAKRAAAAPARPEFQPEAPLTPGGVLGLQRSAGNAAVVRTLRDGRITTGEAAARLTRERSSRPGSPTGASVRFRLPTTADMKAMVTKGDIPEAKLKDAVALALKRMEKESLLKTSDSIPDILKKIFPAPGTFDEAEFEKVVDVADRDKIYKTVVDAETKINAADKPKLAAVMDDAAKLIDNAMADASGLKDVFGKQASLAKGVYDRAKKSLLKAKTNMDTAVDTDYNRDDEQTGLGGWALFSTQHIHLERSVAEVADKDEAKITLIHEACHLANNLVDDRGYYGSDGFEAMPEWQKVANAAHYEELPRRELGTSSFDGVTFKPGHTAAGKATFADEVKREASEYLRMAWDRAVDVHGFVREIRKDIESGNTRTFATKKTKLLEVSRMERLTIHDQTPAPSTVNLIDVVLSEGVARATVFIKDEVENQTAPAAAASGKTKKDHVNEMIDACIKSYGKLTGNDADDRTLMDWLVKGYRKGF